MKADTPAAPNSAPRAMAQFFMPVTASLQERRPRTMKHADTFAVFDRYGNIQRIGLGEQGLYHEGTRFLSRLDLRIHGRRPLLLSSTVKEDNALLAVDLTNPDFLVDNEVVLPRSQVHFFRCSFVERDVLRTARCTTR
jgi:glycogen debranching enzyme